LPELFGAVFTACSIPPQQGTSIRATVTDFNAFCLKTAVSFSAQSASYGNSRKHRQYSRRDKQIRVAEIRRVWRYELDLHSPLIQVSFCERITHGCRAAAIFAFESFGVCAGVQPQGKVSGCLFALLHLCISL
jgi:hypothetical protein